MPPIPSNAPRQDECRAAVTVQESSSTTDVLRLIVSSYTRLISLRHEEGLNAVNADVVLKLLAYKLYTLVYHDPECDNIVLTSYLNALKQVCSMQGASIGESIDRG